MDNTTTKLSEFVTRTSASPGLARDILESHRWNLNDSIQAYYAMKGMNDKFESDVFSERNERFGVESKYQGLSLALVENHANSLAITNTSKCHSEPSLSNPDSPLPNSNDSSVNSSPSKLAISKADINEADTVSELYPKKLARGISRATDNVTLVSRARTEFAQDFRTSLRGSRLISDCYLSETPDFTFTLPDLSIHPPDFTEFLEKDLIEKSSLVSLEGAGRLNWWSDIFACQRLWPLATTGDGNCLLHAASLGMWGFHDRLLTLRKALHSVLVNGSHKKSFYRRWRWQSSMQNKEAGLILCEDEWEREWQSLLKMASTEPRVRATTESPKANLNGGKKADHLPEDSMQPHVYESLEELHILALAHVLKRPIIVIADTMLKDIAGEPFAPIPFGGIYLPIECLPDECHRSPLCLTYDAAHFSALVAMDMETYADKTPHPPAAIPVTDASRALLPLQFAIDPGDEVVWSKDENDEAVIKRVSLTDVEKLELLKTYLQIVQIEVPKSASDAPIVAELPRLTSKRIHVLEKSQTLPSSFEFDDGVSSTDTATVSGASSSTDKSSNHPQSRSKAASQLQLIGRRFGSLGRSMSKRIKKNFGSLAKRGASFRIKRNASPKKTAEGDKLVASSSSDYLDGQSRQDSKLPFVSADVVIAAQLHTERRHEYHDEMIRNYLSTARQRFLNHQKEKKPKTETPRLSSSSSGSEKSTDNYASQCVSPGCINYGTAATNYLCASCLASQKEELIKAQEKLEIRTSPTLSITESKKSQILDDDTSLADIKVPLDADVTAGKIAVGSLSGSGICLASN